MFWPCFTDLQNFILLVRRVPFLWKIIFISSYTEKNNYFLLYELIQDLPYMPLYTGMFDMFMGYMPLYTGMLDMFMSYMPLYTGLFVCS